MSGKVYAAVAATIVVVAVGLGLYVSGSPGEARLYRLDERRESQLQAVSYSITSYHQDRGHLPPTIDSLPIGWSLDSLAFRDPVTGEPYEYKVVGDSTYQLCATFAKRTEEPRYRHDDEWAHPAGRHCFTRQSPLHR